MPSRPAPASPSGTDRPTAPGPEARAGGLWGRVISDDGGNRFACRALAAAVLAYLGLGLYLARGATFTVDELIYFAESGGFSPAELAEPFGGHLTATTRLFYEGSLQIFGASHLPFQLLTLFTAAAAAVLLFFVVRRQVGPPAALAAALVVLFLGSTPVVLAGNATMWAQAPVAGLAAYLALERDSRRGDLLACAALSIGVLSLEVGVAFAVAAAVWLLAAGQARRLWVAAIPLALYAVWWVWALKFDEGIAELSNVLLAPVYAADSAAAATAAATGLGIDLSQGASLPTVALGWGRVLAVGLVALVALGVRRRRPAPIFWAAAAFLAVLWAASTLAYGPLRTPDASRYVYPVVIGLIVLLAASFRGARPGPGALTAIAAVVVVSLSTNLWLLRERGAELRASSDRVEAGLAVAELEREILPAGLSGGITLPVDFARYAAAADEFGSLADPQRLSGGAPATRREADRILAAIVQPVLAPAGAAATRCGPPRPGSGAGSIELPPGGAVIASDTGTEVTLRRFADGASIEVGSIPAGEARALTLPRDGSPTPWVATAATGGLVLCG